MLSFRQDPALELIKQKNAQDLNAMRNRITAILHNIATPYEFHATRSSYHFLNQLLRFNEIGVNPNMSSCLYHIACQFNVSLIDLAPCNFFDCFHLSSHHFLNIMTNYGNLIDTVYSQYTSYESPRDYAYINPVFYNTDNDLLEAIDNTDPSEKWIIFVDNIDQGYTLTELIEKNVKKTTGQDSVVFIHRENRNNKNIKSGQAYQNIINNASFEQRILITTTMLDNGVNLKDIRIKNIVIKTIWQTTFVQMLGRRRRQSNDDTVKLYLQNLSEEELKKKFADQKLQSFLFFNHFLEAQKIFPNQQHPSHQQRWFINTFMHNGHFQPDCQKHLFFQPSIPETLSPYDSMKNVHLLRAYQINPFVLQKITYDSYNLLSILESYRNLRAPLMKEWLREVMKTHNLAPAWNKSLSYYGSMTENEFENLYVEFTKLYQEKEKEISSSQYSWLCTQLIWLGIDYSIDSEFCPLRHEHWYTEILGIHRKKELY